MKLIVPLEVGICVEDLAVMRAFYEDILGFEFVSLSEVPPAKGTEAGMSDTGYRIVRLQANTGERIKLAQPNSPPADAGSPRPILARRAIAFLTFIVSDLQELVASLEEKGVPFRSGPKVEIREGVYLAFAEDPEGNLLEFVEYDDIAGYRPDHVGSS
jgi:lactoylglutathione lyase